MLIWIKTELGSKYVVNLDFVTAIRDERLGWCRLFFRKGCEGPFGASGLVVQGLAEEFRQKSEKRNAS